MSQEKPGVPVEGETSSQAVAKGNQAFALALHADHPFIFMIRERQSGALLFFGRIMRPVN